MDVQRGEPVGETDRDGRLPRPTRRWCTAKLNRWPALMVGACAAVLVVEVLASGMPLNQDAALYLQAARMLLDGATPYVDYVELNPPLVHYLHVVPVALARWLGMDVAMTFQCLVLALVLASTGTMLAIVSRSAALRSKEARALLAAAWMGVSLLIFSHCQFGQREHLMLLAYAPFFFAREACHRGVQLPGGLRVAVGAAAGIGLCLKPHFLVLAAAVDLWTALRVRRWPSLREPELAAVTVLTGLYALHFLLIPAAMRDAFFGRWLPEIVAHYDVYDASWRELVERRVPLGVPFPLPLAAAAAGATLLLAARVFPERRELLEGLSLGSLCALAIYGIQHKGWSYHMHPFVGLLVLLGVAGIGAALDRLATSRGSVDDSTAPTSPLGSALTIFFVAMPLAVLAARTWAHASHFDQQLRPIVQFLREETQVGDRVIFVSTAVYPGNPALVHADRLAGTRFLCAFPIAFCYRGMTAAAGSPFPYRPSERWTAPERRFLHELADDVQRNRPRLVFIDARPGQGCPEGFRTSEYLAQVGWTQEFLADYERISPRAECDVYRRRDLSSKGN